MLEINAERLLADLDELSKIGTTPEGGVSRLALSGPDLEARAWFKARVAEAGLDFAKDGAGNLFATLPCSNPEAKILLAGSHLDSVPNGGRFDGPLGVLSAFEALRTIQEAGMSLPVNLQCVSFTDEEGTWIRLMGSRAFAGTLTRALTAAEPALTAGELKNVHGGPDRFAAALAGVGITTDSLLNAQCDPKRYAGFVEVHIEQGPRLEKADLDVGVVTRIFGIRWQWLRFIGEAAHAAGTPMAQRKDALWGASDFVLRAKALVESAFSPGVMNCGQAQFKPETFNIVPAEVRLALEIRHSSPEQMEAMQRQLMSLAQICAEEYRLMLEIEPVGQVAPAPLDEGVVDLIQQAATDLGLKHTRLACFASHDTQTLSAVMPSAMYFVPSVDGISHNPKEFTKPEDVVNAANVMLHTLLGWANKLADG